MPTAQDRFEELLAHDVATWLKEREFKRRDTTFRRRRDEDWQIVNFQRSDSSDANVVRFTINLGVALDLLHVDAPWHSRGWPLASECDFWERIGHLHKGEDHWWKVRPLLPMRRTVSDVIEALETGLVWLDAHTDPHDLLDQATRRPSKVTGRNLEALVALAKQVGTEAQLVAAETELRRWTNGERTA